MESELLADYWQRPRPVAVKGEGVWIIDKDGRRYLDAAGSVHVVSIGHGVVEVAEAIASQASRLAFASTRHFTSDAQLELAELIRELAPDGLRRCFFASGGSEAMELGLQLAYHWQCLHGRPDKHKFIGQHRSYHGGTLATVSLGGHDKHRRRLAPFLLPFPRTDATPATGGDPASFAAKLDELIEREGPGSVCAFVAEPITGTTSGAIVPPAGWYEAIRTVCDRHDVLFIADEVVTGFGRTGLNFGIQHWSATPDLMITSKGISSGYAPLAAIVVHDRLAADIEAGPERLPLRLTYAGNPLACAAGLAVQKYIQREDLIARCRARGEYLRKLLTDLARRLPELGQPRGLGLLLSVPMWEDVDAARPFPRSARMQERIVEAALAQGLILIGGTGSEGSSDGDHLLLSPPFVISEAECRQLVRSLEQAIMTVIQSRAEER
jgi:adenosylmethionine-8-amino-7-oxononanoate aminotransferase